MTDAHPFDVAVIGAGPAGMAAAERIVGAGLSVVIIDEQQRMGGQILRQPPATFQVRDWLQGSAYRAVKAQLGRTEALGGLTFARGCSVIGLFRPDDGPGFLVVTDGLEGGRRYLARRILIAAGCYDLPVALPGWTLPGVTSAGGLQTLLKSQQFVAGTRFVFAGTHPLQLLVADQIRRAGGEVVAVLFAQPLAHALLTVLGAPLTALRHAGKLASAAFCYLSLARAGAPILFGKGLERVVGDRKVEGVRLAGDGRSLACDAVALCYGFMPQSTLPRLAGAAVRWAGPAGGWATDHNSWMRSSQPGLYVAGETTGMGGADTALCEGALAGLAIALDSGRMDEGAATAAARPHRRKLASLWRFAALLDAIAAPADHIRPFAERDTIICRCEDLTAGTLLDALDAALAPDTANALKLTTRIGMGVCQGRTCEHMGLALLAAKTGQPLGADEGFQSRFPARPVPIADLLD